MAKGFPAIALNPVKIKCPRKCPDRTFDCHGKCRKYAEYRADCDNAIQQRTLKRDVDQAIGDAMKRIPGKRSI